MPRPDINQGGKYALHHLAFIDSTEYFPRPGSARSICLRSRFILQRKDHPVIDGAPPGGGFDTYSRALTRHLGKHIPGNPTMLVDNMPGAAGLVAANYVYKASRPDGLSVGTFVDGLFKEILR
jgi:hypothetical protein